MKRILTTLSVLASIGLGACATAPDHYSGQVVVSTAQATERCEILGELSGSSGLTGLFGLKGVDDIRHGLMRRAEAMGATHVVWGPSTVGYFNTTETARAYRCK